MHFIYSSLSSIATCGPPFADADDDDKIGPDNFKNDPKILPEPPAATGTGSSSKLAWSSSESESSLGNAPGAAAPPKPLEPPKPPVEAPLKAPNLLVIAAIFGEMTAWSNCWSELIGVGGTMPYWAFFAAFVASNCSTSRVFASMIPSIF